MSRLNYGPRFRNSGIASGTYNYDPFLDKRFFFPPKPGTAKAVFRVAKGQSIQSNRRRGISLAGAPAEGRQSKVVKAREEAEAELAQTVRLVITQLQMGLDRLQETPTPIRASYQSYVNPRTIADVLHILRTKSKVDSLP